MPQKPATVRVAVDLTVPTKKLLAQLKSATDQLKTATAKLAELEKRSNG